ncbi:hypothetical protein [Roseibium album]|uniref:Uncharacterized protein n=1 Tax=Roseibium album TaxID=311410 RepID=A0A0M7AAL6_9HYPH|nr:hypothetical protein [Roseibium album]CTQ58471.1 hypothetical protein LA5094_01232 [Roseibium album]CTQ66556.1 hypothetical protein LA5096_01143 [Roseibium album]CTQ71661.1 hypothetical protein LA5095_02287 [Roseibium album]
MLGGFEDSLSVFADSTFTFWASIVFLLLVTALMVSALARILEGRRSIDELTKSVAEIAQILKKREGEFSGPTVDDFNQVLQKRKPPVHYLARVEIANALTGYSDQLVLRTKEGLVSHARLSDVFSGALPARIIDAPGATAMSRRFVQLGLTASVFFITLALISISQDLSGSQERLIASISGKFSFTFVGLAGSIILQVMIAWHLKRATRGFVEFEDALRVEVNVRSIGVSAEVYTLVEEQRQTNTALTGLFGSLETTTKTLEATVGEYNAATRTLKDALADAKQVIESAGETADHTLKTASQEAEKVVKHSAEQAETAIKEARHALESALQAVRDAPAEVLQTAAESAIKFAQQFGKTISESGDQFKWAVDGASSDFKDKVDATGNNFHVLIAGKHQFEGGDLPTPTAETFRQQVLDSGETFETRVMDAARQLEATGTNIREDWNRYLGVDDAAAPIGKEIAEKFERVVTTTTNAAQGIVDLNKVYQNSEGSLTLLNAKIGALDYQLDELKKLRRELSGALEPGNDIPPTDEIT